MQSILGYGFLLKAPDDYPEEQYQEKKAMIEKLCINAWKSCVNAKIEKMNFAIYAQDDIFISISFRNNQIEFALFDTSKKEIMQECSIFDFDKFVNKSRIQALEFRIENECKAIGKGNILKRESLDLAWEEKYQKQQHYEEDSLKADSQIEYHKTFYAKKSR